MDNKGDDEQLRRLIDAFTPNINRASLSNSRSPHQIDRRQSSASNSKQPTWGRASSIENRRDAAAEAMEALSSISHQVNADAILHLRSQPVMPQTQANARLTHTPSQDGGLIAWQPVPAAINPSPTTTPSTPTSAIIGWQTVPGPHLIARNTRQLPGYDLTTPQGKTVAYQTPATWHNMSAPANGVPEMRSANASPASTPLRYSGQNLSSLAPSPQLNVTSAQSAFAATSCDQQTMSSVWQGHDQQSWSTAALLSQLNMPLSSLPQNQCIPSAFQVAVAMATMSGNPSPPCFNSGPMSQHSSCPPTPMPDGSAGLANHNWVCVPKTYTPESTSHVASGAAGHQAGHQALTNRLPSLPDCKAEPVYDKFTVPAPKMNVPEPTSIDAQMVSSSTQRKKRRRNSTSGGAGAVKVKPRESGKADSRTPIRVPRGVQSIEEIIKQWEVGDGDDCPALNTWDVTMRRRERSIYSQRKKLYEEYKRLGSVQAFKDLYSNMPIGKVYATVSKQNRQGREAKTRQDDEKSE